MGLALHLGSGPLSNPSAPTGTLSKVAFPGGSLALLWSFPSQHSPAQLIFSREERDPCITPATCDPLSSGFPSHCQGGQPASPELHRTYMEAEEDRLVFLPTRWLVLDPGVPWDLSRVSPQN